MTEKKGRGRPEHEPSEENREKVRVLKAGGMSDAAIAEAIGISVPTLTKHYSLDIEVGSAKVTAEVMMARYRSALGGSVPAQNKMLETIGATPQKPRGRPTGVAAATKLGKKDQAQADAAGAHEDGRWSGLIQ
jgi:hypothetical protein